MNRPLLAGLCLAAVSLTLLIAEAMTGRVLADAASMGLYDDPFGAPASSGGGASR